MKLHTIINLCAIVLAPLLLACEVNQPASASGMSYYVAVTGNDTDDGSFQRPWRTLRHAFRTLLPGDSLYLRGGTYYERELRVRLSGTAEAPITVQSYPGERATVNGSFAEFTTAPANSWEIVDNDLQLYRSTRSVPAAPVRAWLPDAQVQLVEYEKADNLESTNYERVDGFSPFYMGPGIQRRSDGRLYIRLQPNPSDLVAADGSRLPAVPADPDPTRQPIAVFSSEHILLLDGAAYVHFKSLDFAYSQRIFDVRNGSHHITLNDVGMRYGSYGLVLRNNIHDWVIEHSDFDNGLPDTVYWTDVKNGEREVAEAYPELQSAALVGATSRFSIMHNTFHSSFDALNIDDGASDTVVRHNVFRHLRDDAIELGGVGKVEIAHNLLWHIGSGISLNGSRPDNGPVYIHHNIIDNTILQRGGRVGNYRADSWPVWSTIDPFSSHDSSNKAAQWKIYNNTIVTRKSGYTWNSAGPDAVAGNPAKYVYNNIFYILDDRIAFSDDRASRGSHYDGNVVFRRAPGSLPLFDNFGDGRDHMSLADFQAASGTDWERHGLELDPGFDFATLTNPTFDLNAMWERYRPGSCVIFTAGASYDTLDWPDTSAVSYRGALPPIEGVSCAFRYLIPLV